MRMYARVRSERAEKAQGGNQYVVITLQVKENGDDVHMATIELRPDEESNQYVLKHYAHNDEIGKVIQAMWIKGEKSRAAMR